jgi:hypothetical protein
MDKVNPVDSVDTNVDSVNENANEVNEDAAGQEAVIDYQVKYEALKREARKHEDRAKANFEDAQKYREYTESRKSEDEKRAEELAKANLELATLKAETLKKDIALEKAIPTNLLKYLSGTSREELEEQADELLSVINESAKPKQPLPNPEQGKESNTSGVITDREQLKNMSSKEIMEARKAGRLDGLLKNEN